MMRRKHSAIILMVLILAAVSVLPVSGAMADTGTVKGGWLILRSQPSFAGAIKASYPTGTVVTITGQTQGTVVTNPETGTKVSSVGVHKSPKTGDDLFSELLQVLFGND